MFLKCNQCQFQGDVEPIESKNDNHHLACPDCGLVKIVAAGEPKCDFCYGKPVQFVYVVSNARLPPMFVGRFLERSRKLAACAECYEDVEFARSDPSDEYPLKRIISRSCDHQYILDPSKRAKMRELLFPLWRVMVLHITEVLPPN
jgi:hypothetical protein